MSNDVANGITRRARRRRRQPLSWDPNRHIFAKRPRCPACRSPELRTYKTLPKDGDTICRYVRCLRCGSEYILVLD